MTYIVLRTWPGNRMWNRPVLSLVGTQATLYLYCAELPTQLLTGSLFRERLHTLVLLLQTQAFPSILPILSFSLLPRDVLDGPTCVVLAGTVSPASSPYLRL